MLLLRLQQYAWTIRCRLDIEEDQKGEMAYLMEGWTAGKDPYFKQQQDVGKIAELQHVVVPVLCLVKVEASGVQHYCLDSVVLVKRLWGCSQPVSTQTVVQIQRYVGCWVHEAFADR